MVLAGIVSCTREFDQHSPSGTAWSGVVEPETWERVKVLGEREEAKLLQEIG